MTPENRLAQLVHEPTVPVQSPLAVLSIRVIRAGAVLLTGMSYLLLVGPEETSQLPQAFVNDVSVLYVLLCIAVGLSFTERRTPTLFAIALIALILAMARVTTRPRQASRSYPFFPHTCCSPSRFAAGR